MGLSHFCKTVLLARINGHKKCIGFSPVTGGFLAKLTWATEAALLSSKRGYLFSRFVSNMADYCMYFETVICGYHAYKEDHELTLGEICILESDAAALTYNK